MSRNISPPPTKRRKITSSTAALLPSSATLLPEILPSIDSSHSMRIFSWNVNGIAPFLQAPITSFFQAPKPQSRNTALGNVAFPASLREFLWRHKWPAVLFLQEVKIARHDTKIQDAVKAAVNSKSPSEIASKEPGPTYAAHFTLPNDPQNARGLRGSGKVYGVCSIIRSDIRNHCKLNIRTVDWDKEGRVSVVEVISSSSKLALFNVYAVNGTENVYRDPNTGLITGTRHDRKLEFHRLLMQECLDLEKSGWYILLGGDMNVAPDTCDGYPRLRTFPQQHVVNRKDFHEKLLERKKDDAVGLNGVDIWRKLHGEERKYTYYSRGRNWGTSCDRVDYFIAGRSTWNDGLIKSCGILDSEAERGPSDHVPIWVDILLDPGSRSG
ncbi:DNase I-like protein [Pyrenochaeta sp. DS3sAY3a]|nr:DNase I-like protein [Pyrenochaeta sp. DS3sAY3a]